MPLLDVKTDDPDPSYLRIAVLTQYNGIEWTPGNRQIVSDQIADGLVPLEVPEPEQQHPDRLLQLHGDGQPATSSPTWLPTQFPVSDIVAEGDWHYDTTTMDFRSESNSHRRGTHLHDDRGQARSTPAGRWRTR